LQPKYIFTTLKIALKLNKIFFVEIIEQQLFLTETQKVVLNLNFWGFCDISSRFQEIPLFCSISYAVFNVVKMNFGVKFGLGYLPIPLS